MAYLIDKITQSLAKEGLTPRTNKARAWLRSKVKDLSVSPSSLIRNTSRLKTNSVIGKMYFYFYDPKLKDVLPYYDRFPLVIPIDEYSDGFLGLNLHYIHPKQRMVLLDKLSETLNNNKYDDTTKFRISYAYLKAASKIYEATPCLKRYLYRHVQSRFLEINSNEWDIAALLPAENFIGASTSKVHAESRKKY
jgi:hypothetical protein